MLRFVAIGLGSNVGGRLENLVFAAGAFARIAEEVRFSSVYATEPRDLEDQPDFLNACATGKTVLTARQMLEWAQQTESARHRTREVEKGPRTLDVDVLLFGEGIVDEPDLKVPHPRLPDRRFVLDPLFEIAPDAVDPRSGRSIRQLRLECTDPGTVSRTPHRLEAG